MDHSLIVNNWFINNFLMLYRINITLYIFYRINPFIWILMGILSIMMSNLINSLLMLLIKILLIFLCSFFIIILMVLLVMHIDSIIVIFLIDLIISVLVLIWFIDHLQYRIESLWNLTRNRPSFNNLILCIFIYYHFSLIKTNPFFTLLLHIKLSSSIKTYLNETGSDSSSVFYHNKLRS